MRARVAGALWRCDSYHYYASLYRYSGYWQWVTRACDAGVPRMGRGRPLALRAGQREPVRHRYHARVDLESARGGIWRQRRRC